MAFTSAWCDGVLTLTLETPNSPINVLNREASQQLWDILGSIDPNTTRGVVIDTGKENSFINGVGLLLAQAATSEEDIRNAVRIPWAAYRALYACPVPTVAVVRGSCYGCGVEFILQCDYRVAVSDTPVDLYMTEINDYLFVPVFGSTWHLPRAIDFANAAELLIWGARWGADAAFDVGLVDAVMPSADVPAALPGLLAEGIRRPRIRRSDLRSLPKVQSHRDRIEALAPVYRRVYGEALDLLFTSATHDLSLEEQQQAELRACARSALDPIGKAAYSFFYLRQMARERATGGEWYGATKPLRFAVREDLAPPEARWRAALQRRPCSAFEWTSDSQSADVMLRSRADGSATEGPGENTLWVGSLDDPLREGLNLSFLSDLDRSRVVEISVVGSGGRDVARKLAGALSRCGFDPVLTQPSQRSVASQLRSTFRSSLDEARRNGVTQDQLVFALRRLGFDGALVEQLSAEGPGDGRGSTQSELCDVSTSDVETCVETFLVLGLAGAVNSLRESAQSTCPAIDVLAREALGFPRHLASLCSWLKSRRVADALVRIEQESWQFLGDLVSVRRFVDTRREFYRG